MAKCGSCGADSTRLRVVFDVRNNPVLEECQACAPEHFAEPFAAPSDRRVHEGIDVYPNLYKQGADGVYRAKDELIQDTVDQWEVNGDEEEKKDRKRRTRRTDPMTPDEIKNAKEWGEKCLRPKLQGNRIYNVTAY